jgi:hypothetical protein
MRIYSYDRGKALEYAQIWAKERNPAYFDFDSLGGDCTNFISQCVYAGSNAMNYTPVTGWYYTAIGSRAPAWTGVEFFFKFTVNNTGRGPFGRECFKDELELGDIIQLGDIFGNFYHSLLVTKIEGGNIYISTHTFDRYNYPLNEYIYANIRYIHIDAIRK